MDTTRQATDRFSFLRATALVFLAAIFTVLPLNAQQSPVNPPPPPGYASPQSQKPSDHSIKSRVDLVVLHVSVDDSRGQFFPGLTAGNFRVFEDRVEQNISVFSHDDVPVTMGLVIDNSGSMRDKRPEVNAAALTFVETSNPQDEAFVVNFNDEFYLDTEDDFTSNREELKQALSRIDSRGSTALYDAIVGSLDHLKKGHKDKRVLLVITDGEDDASQMTLPETMRVAEESNAAIYAIGIYSADDRKHDKREVRHAVKALTELTEATGGKAYFPDSVDQVEAICTQVAHDIRNQYLLGYYPTNTAQDGTYRSVLVQLTPPRGAGKLTVRTRAGYYAPKAAPGATAGN
ncbi:MAG TPA: VWA domain-containing protein [Candidatus Acidoferrum sp.]|nr:VWA domain-containing protein [Candidatus Acidoferrum sp.]